MRRWSDGLAVLLLAVLLSACGGRSEEAYGRQTESLEQTEVFQPAEEDSGAEDSEAGESAAEDSGAEELAAEALGAEKLAAEDSAVENSAANEKAEKNNAADGEDTEIQEGGSSVAKENPFDFETKTVTLNSGYEMPIYGLGTYSLTGKTCVDSVTAALNSGVRLIDTAYMYHKE